MKKLASLFVIVGILFISCGNKTNQEEVVVEEDTVVVEETVVVEDTVPAEEVAPVAAAPKKATKKQQVEKAKADVSNAKEFSGASTKDVGGASVSIKPMSGNNNSGTATATPTGGKEFKF